MSWEFERIAGPYNSPLDGPTWDGEGLLFTQLVFPFNSANNRILRYDPQSGAVSDFRRWTNRTVRLAFDGQGTLYGCQSAGRRLVRFNREGSTSPLSHLIGGVFHNMPQDLVADRRGRLWFCDPHGDLMQAMNPQIHDKLDHASVLRLENSNPSPSQVGPSKGQCLLHRSGGGACLRPAGELPGAHQNPGAVPQLHHRRRRP